MKKQFENYLELVLNELSESPVKEAMNYSLLANAKRIRPLLLFAVLQGYGIDPTLGLKCGSAIEMIHTYSLIHDDLPCMDDDDYRRGRLTCHKKFDEATALLAGDALLTQAFIQASHSHTDSIVNNEIIYQLALASGGDGMILGQNKDLMAEHRKDLDLEQLITIHQLKTGKLIALSLVCAALLSYKKDDVHQWQKIGEKIGLAFQIQDDILDVTKTTTQLGKSAGSDVNNEKITSVSLLGLEAAKIEMKNTYQEAIDLIHQISFNEKWLILLLDELSNRQY